jgi:serine/threonine protein kinase
MDQLDRIGRFEPIKLLGRGGMGEVFLARDPLIDRLVAVKLLGAAFDADARERFKREARAAGRLHHEHIVTIFDVGEHDGRPFIAMEYVPGETLAALIRRPAPPPRAELLALLDDACEGLAYAHRAGVAHLDVKPENLIRHDDGPLKILDFGIARVIAADETHTRHVLGTLRYMSPEQLNGGEVDHRSDIFGIGCVLFEMVTGQPAFGATWPEVMARVTSGEVPRPSEFVPGLPAELDRIAVKAMAFDPAERYDDLDALREELAAVRPAVEGAPVRSSTAAVPSGSRRTPRPATGAVPAPAASATSARPRWLRPLVAAAVVGAVGVQVWRGTNRPASEQPPPSTPAAAQAPSPAPSQPEPVANPLTPSAFASEVWPLVARRDYDAAVARLQANPELAAGLLGELRVAAVTAVTDARGTAEARGRAVRDTAEYQRAVNALARSRRLDETGPSVDGLAALWEAADAFTRATPPAAAPKVADAAPPADATSDMVKRALETAEQAMAKRPPPPPPAPAPGTTGTADPSRSIVIPIPSVPLPDRTAPQPPSIEKPVRAAPTPEAGARAALAAYETAYRLRDIAALRRVYPGMSAAQVDALTRTFAESLGYGLNVRVVNLTVGEATVTATCEVTHSLVPKVGSPSRTTQTARFHLAPAGGTWVIQRIDAEAP